MGLKDWLAKPEKPKGRGYKGWHAEVEPNPNWLNHWSLSIYDDEGHRWKPGGITPHWTLIGNEKSVRQQAFRKLKALADQEIAKRNHANAKRIVI